MQPVFYMQHHQKLSNANVFISLANSAVSVCNRYTKNKQMQKANKMAADRDAETAAVLKRRRETREGD